MEKDDLLSIQEVLEILNVSHQTLDHWVKSGLLKPILKEGDGNYFHPVDVRTLVEMREEAINRKKRILVIEDDPLVGSSLKNLLEGKGFEIFVAPVGLAALDVIAREEVDLILTDIRMPGMNGLEALKAIRALSRQFGKPDLPEIVLTAYDDEKVKQEAERMGVKDFFLKPFEVQKLIEALSKYIAADSVVETRVSSTNDL